MPRPARLLIVEGNVREQRDEHRASFGQAPGESYADAVRTLNADVICDIAFPADEGANLPDPAGLQAYDGVFLTGSALHIYRIEPAVTRQIELMRAVYASATPCFGSCWGLQIGAVAAGGRVIANPNGREIGFARRITMTDARLGHPLLAGRPAAYDAPAIHLDAVVGLPAGAITLARNSMTAVQAAEIHHDGGVFWGVQYHPEFSLAEVAAILRRRPHVLIDEGFRADAAAVAAYCDDLVALDRDPARSDLAWAHGLDAEVLDPARRLTEIANFLSHRVYPTMSARSRA
jgi:GMP synthase (glutamine-hydrolysing)